VVLGLFSFVLEVEDAMKISYRLNNNNKNKNELCQMNEKRKENTN